MRDAGTTDKTILERFVGEYAFADLSDYLEAVAAVEGEEARKVFDDTLNRLVTERLSATEKWPGPDTRRQIAEEVRPLAVLLAMPEGDFLTSLELGAKTATDVFAIASLPDTADRICQRRGIPYRVHRSPYLKFVWVGEPTVHEQAIAPALGVLDDPRLSGGPRAEFLQARKELREGSPQARKQAVAEACNAVESTMKVLLDERDASRPARENAQDLFNALLGEGLVSKEAEELVLAAARFGNRRGRHGAGPVQHDVPNAEAEAVVASAAVSIVLLASALPGR